MNLRDAQKQLARKSLTLCFKEICFLAYYEICRSFVLPLIVMDMLIQAMKRKMEEKL